ncbi:cation transporter [Siculibacillus lacustris]|uniref:Protein p34 n=1 Tax=Siculibacillus lacustris TaxID=1549641 RepID=A0A4Q9VGX6_9HYPH|nr:cation diffusion facilitator family transporter [Siculibacillus lacustris]TBW33788.1 cation transporter [Siculibacillus lacustris]
MDRTIRIAAGSIVVGLIVLALKLLAWWVTGSVALLSDGLESTVNVATAIAALIAIHVAARPADAKHPYGHHKAEFFSAVLEGVMIIVAAILIIHEAYKGFLAPQPLEAPLVGLLINGVASALNGFWCWVLVSQGKKLRSPALVADGHHLLSDVISSVGVVLGVLLAVITGWMILDPLLAAIVALNILWSGWQVTRSSLSGLLDEAVSDETLAEIRATIGAHAGGALEAHDIRTRHAGKATFVDFHLVVPGTLSVREAHAICDRIETALAGVIAQAVVTIHVEPEGEAEHRGVFVI